MNIGFLSPNHNSKQKLSFLTNRNSPVKAHLPKIVFNIQESLPPMTLKERGMIKIKFRNLNFSLKLCFVNQFQTHSQKSLS